MLQQLEHSRGFILGGQSKTIGGEDSVTDDDILDCIGHLKVFLTLTTKAISTEFPTFDLMSSFSVFRINVQSRKRSGDDLDPEWKDRCFQRIAKTLKVDKALLLSQFSQVKPIAAHEALALQDGSTFQAWQTAVQRICSRRRTQENIRTGTLAEVLAYYGSWNGLCTSGVEQSFSIMCRAIAPERRHMSEACLLDELQLHFDGATCGRDTLCTGAVVVWQREFGIPRKSCFNQITIAKREQPSITEDGRDATETAFRKRRRAEVAASAKQVSMEVVESAAREGSAQYWSASAYDEEKWQENRHYKARVQALLENTLVESEIDEELVMVAQAYKDQQADADAKRLRKEAKADDLLRPLLLHVQEHPYYVADAAFAALPGVDSSRAVQDLFLASTFVVKDPASPPCDVLWKAMLLGGFLADKDALVSNGRSGVAFHCSAALHMKRSIYISDDFRAQHAPLFTILDRALNEPDSKWRRLQSWEEFSDKSHAACGDHVPQKKTYQVVALASRAEAAAVNMANVMDQKSFESFMLRQSVAKKGFGGR